MWCNRCQSIPIIGDGQGEFSVSDEFLKLLSFSPPRRTKAAEVALAGLAETDEASFMSDVSRHKNAADERVKQVADKLVQDGTILSKNAAYEDKGEELPVVWKPRTETYPFCPHCDKEIHDKHAGVDRNGVSYHRDYGKSIRWKKDDRP